MSESLYDLVKTLNKAEKRLFSESLKSTKRSDFYSKLITYYCKSKSYCSELDYKIFETKNTKVISDCKNTFKHSLFRFLVSLEKSKNIKHKVEEKLKISQMLWARNQYTEAKKVLEKADYLATKFELPHLMIKIKSEKIFLASRMGVLDNEIDLENVAKLVEDKNEAINHLCALSKVQDEYRSSWLDWIVKEELSHDKKGASKNKKNVFKSLSIQLRTLETNYNRYCMNEEFELAFEKLEQLLELASKNRKVVLEAKLLMNSYPYYIGVLVELGILNNKEIDFEAVVNLIDDVGYKNIYERLRLFSTKTIAYCNYSLHTNNPDLAANQLKKREELIGKVNLKDDRDNHELMYVLFTYFAQSNWDKCIEYYSKMQSAGFCKGDAELCKLVKLISVYEKEDHYYFNSLVDQYMNRRKRNGITIKDCSNFNECFFNILYYIAKGKKDDLSLLLNRVLDSFGNQKKDIRYLIYWLVNQFPELQNDSYFGFLEKHNFKHFKTKNLRTIQANSINKISLP